MDKIKSISKQASIIIGILVGISFVLVLVFALVNFEEELTKQLGLSITISSTISLSVAWTMNLYLNIYVTKINVKIEQEISIKVQNQIQAYIDNRHIDNSTTINQLTQDETFQVIKQTKKNCEELVKEIDKLLSLIAIEIVFFSVSGRESKKISNNALKSIYQVYKYGSTITSDTKMYRILPQDRYAKDEIEDIDLIRLIHNIYHSVNNMLDLMKRVISESDLLNKSKVYEKIQIESLNTYLETCKEQIVEDINKVRARPFYSKK